MDRVLDRGIRLAEAAGEEAVRARDSSDAGRDRRRWPSVAFLQKGGKVGRRGAGGARRRNRCRERRRRRPWPCRCRSGARQARCALASLCSRASGAERGSATWAQRHAGLRLTAIAMPMPEPQTAIPRSASAVGKRLGQHRAKARIIDAFVAVGAEVERPHDPAREARRTSSSLSSTRHDRRRGRCAWPFLTDTRRAPPPQSSQTSRLRAREFCPSGGADGSAMGRIGGHDAHERFRAVDSLGRQPDFVAAQISTSASSARPSFRRCGAGRA